MARLKPLWLELPALAARLRSSAHLLVASDFDGTLSGIAPHPDAAGLDPRTRRALRALVALPGARVAILSGRALPNLRAKVGVRGVLLSGTVGLESEDPDGRRDHVSPRRAVPGALRESLVALCERFDGAWLEDKRLAVTTHYRHVPARLQRRFVASVRSAARLYRDRVRLVEGKKVVEVLPPGTWNKASSLGRWLHRSGELVVFLGDDVHDEPVHALVRARGGIAIAVGRERSRAEYVLATPDEVTWWLEWLAREWRERRR